ncbi:hypothetical protein B0A48_07311 [Cryoendolithus antarcticus]|uniref:Uncharacterized protein n=1 Tax=Cryoendolithus antarcticus TaxID=1507870 RepID=A0A1V8T8K7_9PEZI|nr:hypothetical protein B0A48_07311 [Cryoendolithus antarcticus]
MEVPRQPSSVSSSFEDPLMSKRTTPSAPASELGNLNISSSSSGSGKRSMPVTTRAMYRTYAAPRDTPSRTTAGPSRPSQRSGQASSSAASRRAPLRRAAAAEASGGSAAEDSDDDDESDEEEEDEDEDEDQRASRSPTGDALIRLSVLEIFALSDSSYLNGMELLRANGGSSETTYLSPTSLHQLSTNLNPSQLHRRLALTVADQAIAFPAFNASLQAAMPVPSPVYSGLMLDRMSLRLARTLSLLQANVRNASQGADVITTAASLRSLTSSIATLTQARHWSVTSRETKSAYCLLLLNLLAQVLQWDRDAYAGSSQNARPSYAGQRAEHTNLYLCLIGNPPNDADPAFVVDLLQRLDPQGEYLAGNAHLVERVWLTLVDKYTVLSADGGRTSRGGLQPSERFWAALQAIRNGMMTPP